MKLLQKSAPYIAPYIAKLVNNSIIKGVLQVIWSSQKCHLYLKRKTPWIKGIIDLIALSKVYEKAMSLQISDYFSSIFSALLSAFRKGYSCQSTPLNMIDNFKCALDRGEYIACISVDMIVYLTAWLFVNYMLMDFPGTRVHVRWLLVICTNENRG